MPENVPPQGKPSFKPPKPRRGAPGEYPKWVTSPEVGPVIVENPTQEDAVLGGKAKFDKLVSAQGTTYTVKEA